MRHWLIISILFFIISCSNKPNQDFKILQKKLSHITDPADRQALTDRFLQKLSKKDYPVFENDSTVVLLYKGNAEKVEMIGDLNYWTNATPLTNIKNTDLHYLRLKIPPNSVPEYWFIINDHKTQIDSLNQYKIKNEFGYASQIVHHNNPFYLDKIEKNEEKMTRAYLVPIDNHKYVKIHVYFPPQYNDYDNYPLAIFLDGKKYIEMGEAPQIIDNLIHEGKIGEIIAVFAELGFNENKDELTTEYFQNIKVLLSNNILDFLNKRFSALNNTEDRLLVGKSVSGAINIFTALENPDKFGNVFTQSGYLSADNFFLKQFIDENYNTGINFYFQIGRYERNVSHMIIPPDETDFYAINHDFVKLMKERGFKVKIEDYAAGHTWGNWKKNLSDGLIYFFGKKADKPG